MRVGILVTGDVAVRAAHSLAAHPGVDEVVVIGPARSRSFPVVEDPAGCDLLVGTGAEAPARALRLGIPLVWDGGEPSEGVGVWGADLIGLALALADREEDPTRVAVATPGLAEAEGTRLRFPDPVGNVVVAETVRGGRPVLAGRSPNRFAACLVEGPVRRVAMVDDGAFMAGIALAAAATLASPGPVWEQSLDYLRNATVMGLVMAEDAS